MGEFLQQYPNFPTQHTFFWSGSFILGFIGLYSFVMKPVCLKKVNSGSNPLSWGNDLREPRCKKIKKITKTPVHKHTIEPL